MTARSVRQKPIEHREPTPGTVRELYGTAFGCGKPDCGAALYAVDDSTGRRVLNSRVAHIHARREGGPRWNPEMSEADNRDASNLLLLCLLHAWEVDAIPEQYPAGVLRAWKRAQLDEYERVRAAWQITDAEAQEAVAPLDLRAAIEAIADVVPFSPRMRSRVEAWQLAVRRAWLRQGRDMSWLEVLG